MNYTIYFEGEMVVEAQDEDIATQEVYDRLKKLPMEFKITSSEEN